MNSEKYAYTMQVLLALSLYFGVITVAFSNARYNNSRFLNNDYMTFCTSDKVDPVSITVGHLTYALTTSDKAKLQRNPVSDQLRALLLNDRVCQLGACMNRLFLLRYTIGLFTNGKSTLHSFLGKDSAYMHPNGTYSFNNDRFHVRFFTYQ